MDPAELERLMEQQLRDLPAPRAPRTLLPRILMAVDREAERPWYRRAWRAWPPGWQAASAASVLLVLAAAGLLLSRLELAAPYLPAWLGSLPVLSGLSGLVRNLGAAWNAWQVVWRVVIEPVAGYLTLFVLVMSAACVLFATALDRVALGGASKP